MRGVSLDAAGKPAAAPRVEERLRYLSNIANSGDKPGRFANLLNFGQGLTSAYLAGGIPGADRFAGLTSVNQVAVTGRAYSWMTDKDYYNPGGNFVTIPDAQQGLLGQFFGGVASPGTSAVAVDVHHSRLHFSMGEKTNWNPAFSRGGHFQLLLSAHLWHLLAVH